MTEKKDIPARPSIGMDHKGAVLPSAPSKAPMPPVKPTEGAKPSPPSKAK